MEDYLSLAHILLMSKNKMAVDRLQTTPYDQAKKIQKSSAG